ncbi:MAG: YgfZ/GcvT domain-containing protein [Actinomycetota bacterium]
MLESAEIEQVVWSPVRHRALSFTGRDAGTYLHSQLSNDIMSLAPGESCQSFVLEPTGKVDALVRVTRLEGEPEDRYLIDVDGDDIDHLTARLERFKIRVQAEMVPVPVVVLAVRTLRGTGDGAEDLARRLAGGGVGDDIVVVPAWWSDGRSFDVIMVGADGATWNLDQLEDASLRYGSVDESVIEEVRIANGWPAMGAEIEPGETIPAATGVVGPAVSFTKGCYPGQELVERMDSRGAAAPRSLRILRLSETGPLERGDSVRVDGAEVGVVTSVGRELVLAYVARSVSLGVVVGET